MIGTMKSPVTWGARSLVGPLTIVLLGFAPIGCGGSSGRAQSSAGASTAPTTQGTGESHADVAATAKYGQAATPAETSAITAAIKRYYAVAAAGNGAEACKLLFSLFAEAVVEDYGQEAGPASLRGNTCAEVMSKLFRERHQQLVTQSATLAVAGVRVHRNKAIVLLRFANVPEERNITVHLEANVWKVDALLDRRGA